MATTSPDNLRTPNPGDPYNLVADLATLANDTQVALNKKVSNLLTGTAAQRVTATTTATAGMLWQDTDGIKMIWRKDGASWVPAVWRWSGTTSQRTGFTQAPTGFEWYDTTNSTVYVKSSTGWNPDSINGAGWVSAGAPAWGTRLPLQYIKVGNRVYVEGYTSTTSAGTNIFTLPSGFRPQDQIRTRSFTSGSSSETITVSSAGLVASTDSMPSGTAISLKFDFPTTW